MKFVRVSVLGILYGVLGILCGEELSVVVCGKIEKIVLIYVTFFGLETGL